MRDSADPPVGAVGAATKRKPKRFTTQGSIYGVGLVTHYDFLLNNCPGTPATQGVDAYVVEVPAEFQSKPRRSRSRHSP